MGILIIIALLFYIAIEEHDQKTKRFNNFTGQWERSALKDPHSVDVLGPF